MTLTSSTLDDLDSPLAVPGALSPGLRGVDLGRGFCGRPGDVAHPALPPGGGPPRPPSLTPGGKGAPESVRFKAPKRPSRGCHPSAPMTEPTPTSTSPISSSRTLPVATLARRSSSAAVLLVDSAATSETFSVRSLSTSPTAPRTASRSSSRKPSRSRRNRSWSSTGASSATGTTTLPTPATRTAATAAPLPVIVVGEGPSFRRAHATPWAIAGTSGRPPPCSRQFFHSAHAASPVPRSWRATPTTSAFVTHAA